MNKKIKWLSLVICMLFITTAFSGTIFSGVIDSSVDNTQSEENKIVQENAIIQLQLKRNDNTAITSRGCIQNIVSFLQPTVVITSPDDGSVFTEPGITLTGYAVDEIGIDYINYTHEWEEGANCSSWTIDPPVGYYEFAWEFVLYEGWNRIKVTAGNVNEMYGCDEIIVYYNPGEEDTEPPVVVIGYPSDGSIFFDPIITVTGYATDNVGITIIGVHHEWEGGEASTSRDVDPPQTHVSFEVVNLELRLNWNRITVFAEDEAENYGYDEVTVTFTTDAESPVIIIQYPEDGAIFTEPDVAIIGEATDNVGITQFGYTHEWEDGANSSTWSLEEPATSYLFDIPVILHESWNRITVFAEDEAENEGEDSILVTYLIDTTPPLIEKIKPTNAIYMNDRKIMPFIFPVIIGSVTIEVNAMDNETGVHKVDFYINDEIQCGDAKEPYLWKWGGTCFGFHTIKIVAYDNASNRGEHEEKVFIINRGGATTDLPEPVIKTPAHEQAVGGEVRINVTEANNATDIVYCKFSYFDGIDWYEIGKDYGYVIDSYEYRGKWFAYWHTDDLTSGYYKLRTEMENTKGYIGYDEIEVEVEEPPVIEVDVTEYDPEIGRTVFDAGDSYDPDGSITNYTWTFWTYPNITTLEGEVVEYVYLGDYTFTIEAVDNLNVSSIEMYWSIKGSVEKKFVVEVNEIGFKTDKLKKILNDKKKLEGKIPEELAKLNFNLFIGYLGNTIVWLESIRERLVLSREVIENLEHTELQAANAIIQLENAIKHLVSAAGYTKDANIKEELRDNIKELREILIQIYCLSAKLYILIQIGPTAHGADVEMPKAEVDPDKPCVYDQHHQTIVMKDSYLGYYDLDLKKWIFAYDIVLHEYDHHFMHKKNHKRWLPATRHSIDKKCDKKNAWSEGWATFSSCAKRNSPIYCCDPNAPGWNWDLENCSAAGADGELGTSDDIPIPPSHGGYEFEASVAHILWDLFDDTPNEREDGNKVDEVSLSFKTICEAMNIKKTDPGHGTIHDFYCRLRGILMNQSTWNALNNSINRIFRNHDVVPRRCNE